MKRVLIKALAAGAAGFVVVSASAGAFAAPVELSPSALDAVTAGAVANAGAGAIAVGTRSTASTVTNTLAVKVPHVRAAAAAAGAGAGAGNPSGAAHASVSITYGIGGAQAGETRSATKMGLAAVLVAGMTANMAVH
jgi:hypothetical protein